MSFLTRRVIQNVKQSPILRNMCVSYTNYKIKRRPSQLLVDNKEITVNKDIPFLREVLEKNLNVTQLIQANKDLSSNDWLNAREELFKMEFINEKNIDALISNICFSFKNDDAFTSYVQYLKNNDYEINLYIKTTYVSRLAEKKVLTEPEKQEIYDFYDSLRKKYSIFDGKTCSKFIQALCVTDRWEEAIELLDMVYYSNKTPSLSISTIIKAAFDNNKPEIGWKYLIHAADNQIFLLPQAFSSYLEYCLKTSKDKGLLERNLHKIIEFLHDKEVLLNKNVLDDYLTVFGSLGYNYSETTINIDGKCMKCSHKLPPAIISQEEFKELSMLFMKNVVVNDNIYGNTTPTEFKRFLKFLENAMPYDIVIDGLNLAFSSNRNSDSSKAANLSNAVKYFINKDKKILLLGRLHMMKWNNMGFVKHNTKMFLFQNCSMDDPYLIYATLYGGMETCFVSGDLMRQHKAKLPEEMKRLFKFWQLSHQYVKNSKANSLIYPVKYETIPHKDENGWHLPYFIGESFVPKDSYNPTVNWICLRKKCK